MESADDLRLQAAADFYIGDFYSWTRRQADLLCAGLFEAVDLANVIEEIATLGRSEATALESAYRLICLHQLERIVQPERAASRSWTNTIIRERLHAARVVRANPGLEPRQVELFQYAYADAREEAAGGTGLPLDTIPDAAPFSLAQVMDEDFWGEPARS